MPEYPEVAQPGEEGIELGRKYQIKGVEDFISDLQKHEGLKVTLVDSAGDEIAIALWTGRKTVGRKSKFGSFAVALGGNPSQWIGKEIVFVSWTRGNRVIEKIGKK